MEIRTSIVVAALAVVLMACGSDSKPPAEPQKAAAPAPVPAPPDESSHLPKGGLLESHVVAHQLLGKPFMPGGTLGHYKIGAKEFDMFVARMPSAQDAAFLLPDWSKALANSVLVPSFGGYFGDDGGRGVFIFPKGVWIAGVVGLPQKDADVQARALAGRLN